MFFVSVLCAVGRSCIEIVTMAQEGNKSPKEYFIEQLTGHGIKVDPIAFNNPKSRVNCVALKYRTEDELPQLYDKALLSVFYEGSVEEVRDKVLGEKSARVANAQNANGETVLMKVCRRALVNQKKKGGDLNVISLLLKSGANPMVCCDSGKNVLHDVFWTAKPPPSAVLEAMEKMVDILREATGKNGILELMLSEDKHGYTPLDYVVPSQQPNWRKVVDTVVTWASEEASQNLEARREETPSGQQRKKESAVAPSMEVTAPTITSCQLELDTCDQNFANVVVKDMIADDKTLVVQLCSHKSSFLISDIEDPDAAIVAVSPAFVSETGYEPDEVLGRNCRFLQGPGTSTAQVDLIRRALATTATVNVSVLNYKKDGETFINNFLLTPLRRRNGTVVYYLGVQNCREDIAADRRRRLEKQNMVWIDDDTDENPTSHSSNDAANSEEEEENTSSKRDATQLFSSLPSGDTTATTTTTEDDRHESHSNSPERNVKKSRLSPCAVS